MSKVIAVCMEGTLVSTHNRQHHLHNNDYDAYHLSIYDNEVDSEVLKLVEALDRDDVVFVLYSSTPEKYKNLFINYLEGLGLSEKFEDVVFKDNNDYSSSIEWKSKVLDKISPDFVVDNSDVLSRQLSDKPYFFIGVK